MESIEVRVLRELHDREKYGQPCNEITVNSDVWNEMRSILRENTVEWVWLLGEPMYWTFMGMKVNIDDSLPSTCFKIQ